MDDLAFGSDLLLLSSEIPTNDLQALPSEITDDLPFDLDHNRLSEILPSEILTDDPSETLTFASFRRP